jgi:DNA invertase Pin-like site-specific DNA recombinase
MADVGYARVSTLDQDPGLQLDALARAGCASIYEERVSGVSTKRPVRDQALTQLKPGDTLTVWKLDRLGRSVTELHQIIEDLEQRRIRFRCLTQPIDTSSPTGKFFFSMLAAFADFERDMITERVRAGKQRMMAEGRHPGGRALFGFEDDHVTVIEDQAQLLRGAARRVLDGGHTLSNVVDDWNARGLRPGEAAHWRVTHLRRILLNERVVPIIGQDAHDRLRRLFTDPERRKGGRPTTYLLSGILTCGREGCGRPLYGARRTRRDGAREDNYRCEAGKGSGGRFTGCGRTSVAMARADAWAAEAFIAAIASDEFTQALDRRQAELLAGDVIAAELDDWRAEIADLDQVQGTRFYSDAMRRRHDELRRMVDRATARLLQRPDLQALLDLPRSEKQLRAAWDAWDVTTRRAWLKRILDRIEVKPTTTRGPASDTEARLDPVWKL